MLENKKSGRGKNKFELAEEYLLDKYSFRFNTINHTYEALKKDSSECSSFQVVEELRLLAELKRNGYSTTSQDIKAMIIDNAESYDPIKTYLDSLTKWDQKVDYIEKLSNYIRLANEQNRTYFITQLKKMMVRTIASAINEKVFNKQVFVLVHYKQNSGKSTFCRWLCPEQLRDYYTEDIDLHNKDGLIALAQNMFINLDELATLFKSEANKLKSMISQLQVKVRRPYEAKTEMMNRRCSFLASTNETEFLSDGSGSVRWICFEIDSIDWNYSKDLNIDNLWSQAYQLYNSGFDYQLSKDEIEHNELINKQFQITSQEAEYVLKFFKPAKKGEPFSEFLQCTDIKHHIEINTGGNKRLNNTSLGKALTSYGFIKEQRRVSERDYPIRGYWVIRHTLESQK